MSIGVIIFLLFFCKSYQP